MTHHPPIDNPLTSQTALPSKRLSGPRRFFRIIRRTGLVLVLLFLCGFLVPEYRVIPVDGASPADWNPSSFWHHPWGRSVVHKGIDIFAKRGTPVIGSTSGLVLSTGDSAIGGKTVLMLGPKWRFHYYSHLDRVDAVPGQWVNRRDVLGAVGDSGNAKGKPCHLHYTVFTPLPYPWRVRNVPRGWQRMFYLDPDPGWRVGG